MNKRTIRMDKLTAISVIIPTFNCAKYIGEAIDSALSQTLKPSEIIVVDDGSQDNTKEVVGEFRDVTYVYRSRGGPGAARNVGIEMASSDWISFLDADDVWDREHLKKVAEVIIGNGTVWGFGGIEEVGEDGRISPLSRNGIPWLSILGDSGLFDDFFEAFLRTAPFSTPGLVINKNILNEIGRFDKTFLNHQDLDLFFRTADRYPKVSFVWPSTVKRRIWTGSHSYGKRFNSLIFLNKYHGILQARENGIARLREFLIDKAIIQALDEKDMSILEYLDRRYPDQMNMKKKIANSILSLPDYMVEPIKVSAVWLNYKYRGLSARLFDRY